MNPTEKAADLPENLLTRDRGGMYFPKKCFLSAIRNVLEAVQTEADGANIEKYGSNFAKVSLQL